jgi:hypothetical protein
MIFLIPIVFLSGIFTYSEIRIEIAKAEEQYTIEEFHALQILHQAQELRKQLNDCQRKKRRKPTF